MTGAIIVSDGIINNGSTSLSTIEKLGLPIVIKPIELGSSVGMSIAKNEAELAEGIKTAFEYSDEVLLEKFIKGRELTCAIIGNSNTATKALPIIEIIPKYVYFIIYRAFILKHIT